MKNIVLNSYVIILLVFGFLSITVYIHFANSELDVLKYPLSLYALAKYGKLLKAGFYMIAASEIFLAAKLYLQSRHKYLFTFISLGTAGMAIIFIAIFPMDVGDSITFNGTIHVYAAVVHFIFFSLAAILYGKKETVLKTKYFSLATGFLTLILLIVMIIILRNEDATIFNYYGLVQKIDIILILNWLAIISIRNH